MAENHDIYDHPLEQLEPAELHVRGLDQLARSLDTDEPDGAVAYATQAMAFFFASVSATALAEDTGSHRAVASARDDRTMGERVRSG